MLAALNAETIKQLVDEAQSRYDKNPIEERFGSVSLARSFFAPQSANQAAANTTSTESCPSSTYLSK